MDLHLVWETSLTSNSEENILKCQVTKTILLTFIRRFYPKRLTITFRLYIFISMCVPWESNPQPFALLTQCSTTEPHRNMSNKKKYFCQIRRKRCKWSQQLKTCWVGRFWEMYCIRVGWINQTNNERMVLSLSGHETKGHEKRSRWDRCPVHGKTSNSHCAIDPSFIMTEITESTIKSHSSSTNCDKTGMTGSTSVAFSLNTFLSTNGHVFHSGCSSTNCDYSTGHR